MTFQRAPENDAVNAQEDKGHGHAADGVHGVPPARLRLGGVHDAAVELAKVVEFADLGHEGLGDLDLADDLSEAAIGLVDVGVLFALVLLPARGGQRSQPHVDGEEGGEQDR